MEMKRKNQQRFLLTPIKVSRQKLQAAQQLAAAQEYEKAVQAVRGATLDCLTDPGEPTSIEQFVTSQYAKLRSVCTWRIVLNGATVGPGRVDELMKGVRGQELRDEAYGAITKLTRDCDKLYMLLQDSCFDNKARDLVPAAFQSAYGSLDRFELALAACLGADESMLRTEA
eukprot:jgi/Chlat1/723/Chrsp104S08607